MCKLFFPTFANLLFAQSLSNVILGSSFLIVWLASALLIDTTVALPNEKTSSALRQYRKLENPKIGSYPPENITTALLCSGASGHQTSSNCGITVLPTSSGNKSMNNFNTTRVASISSSTKNIPLSEWQKSQRSKPGTSSLTMQELSTVSSTIHALMIPDSSIAPTQTLHLLTTRHPNAKHTFVINKTSTYCEILQNGSSSASWSVSPRPYASRSLVASMTITSTASSTNSNVSPSIFPIVHSPSIQHTSTSSGIAHQGTSTIEGLTYRGPSRTNNTIGFSQRYSGAASMITVSNSSRTILSTRSPLITTYPLHSSMRSSLSLTNSSLQFFAAASHSTKLSRSITLRTSSRPNANSVSVSSSSNTTTSAAWLETGSFNKKPSPFDLTLSTGHTTSTAPLTTRTNTTISGSSRTMSMLSSSLHTTPGSAIRAGSSQFSSQYLLMQSSKLENNVSAPLTTCAITSQTRPVTTSWMAGACKLTSFDDPTSTLKCASSTITPLPVTACACPDGKFYEQMVGGVGPCNDYTSVGSSEFLEPILTCTDTPTNCIPPSTLMTPTSTPPSIPYGGHFSAIPIYPSTCDATTLSYSSTKSLATGQIMIDSSIGWGNANSQWKFRAGGGVKIDRMNNTSNPGTSIFSGNWEPASENFIRNTDGSWTMRVVPDMPSLSLIAVTSGGATNKSFPFTVTSVIPCDKPVALQCNNSFSDLTQNQWVAFEVDEFVTMIEKDFKATNGPNFFGWFLDEYVGDTIKAPCQIDQEGCQPLSDPCTFVKPGPYQRQAFFVVNAMITLSRYIRYAWLAYERSRGDLLSELAAWTTAFVVPEKTQTWQNIVAITASVFGILSVIGFAAGPFMPLTAAIFTPLFVGALSSGLFGVNSLLNTAINAANANGAAVAAEVQFDGYAKADQAMNAYINASEQALIDTNNAYFLHGTNISQVLQGGLFVAKTSIAELTDGDFSGAVTAAADWFDKTMIWSLINEAWKADDNYIVFLPYGPVTWYSGKTRQFTAEMCHDQFLGNDHWNGTIYGSCDAGPPDHPGFASFMTAQKLMDFNEYNEKSYYEVSYSYQNYIFDADDVFKSSIAGYYQSGYNYNATSIPVGQLLTEQNQQPVAEYVNQTATSPGIFNVPVCIISDTSYVPGCTISNWGDRGDPCYTSPKQCLQSKWIDPKDPTHIQNFTSYVSNNVVSGLQDATTYDNLWKT